MKKLMIISTVLALVSAMPLHADIMSSYFAWKGIPFGHGNLSWILIGAGVLAEFVVMCWYLQREYVRILFASIAMNALSIALGGLILVLGFLTSSALYWTVLQSYFDMLPDGTEMMLFSMFTIPFNILVEYPIAGFFLPMISPILEKLISVLRLPFLAHQNRAPHWRQ